MIHQVADKHSGHPGSTFEKSRWTVIFWILKDALLQSINLAHSFHVSLIINIILQKKKKQWIFSTDMTFFGVMTAVDTLTGSSWQNSGPSDSSAWLTSLREYLCQLMQWTLPFSANLETSTPTGDSPHLSFSGLVFSLLGKPEN